MKRLLLVSAIITSCFAAATLGQIAPGANPDAGAPPAADPAGAVQPTPLDEAALRERMAQAAIGRVAVRAVQGTPYGSEVGVAPVEILLVHRGQVVHSEQAELDEHGVVVFENLPVAMEVTPVVQVGFSGVHYQNTGTAISPTSPETTVEVTVYDTTEERPGWHVAMRHVQIERSAEGILVHETVITNNPGQSTWLGTPVDDSPEPKRDAAQFRLPKTASQVQLVGGFHGWCCTRLDPDGLLSVQMPMMPGRSQFTFMYLVPNAQDASEVLVSAPAPTDNMVAFFVDDGSEVELKGMTDAGSEPMGQVNVRMFQAEAMEPGQLVGLSIGQLPASADLASVSQRNSQIKLFAAIGGGIVLLAGVAAIFLKAPRQAQATN